MDPAAAALDLAKAGAIIANMIESYLAAGAPPFNAEGADHAESEDCRSSSDAESLHLHSSVDDGASALQSGEHRAPVIWRTRQSRLAGCRSRSESSTGSALSEKLTAHPKPFQGLSEPWPSIKPL